MSNEELGTLIRDIHAINQAVLPLVLFGAGLPCSLPALTHSKSLTPIKKEKAICDPVEAESASISDAALHEIYIKPRGYPYFQQEWGYTAWNIAQGDVITEDDARAATAETAESARKLIRRFSNFALIKPSQ